MKISRCKVCNHPNRAEIDALLLNPDVRYSSIVERIALVAPQEDKLTPSSLSRHKKDHLLTKPIETERVDPETGEVVKEVHTGHMHGPQLVDPEFIPKGDQVVTLTDALAVVINAGVANITRNPRLVGPKVLVDAIKLAKELGVGTKEENAFNEAWSGVADVKKAEIKAERKRWRQRTVTVREEEGEVGTEENVVEGETQQARPKELPEPVEELNWNFTPEGEYVEVKVEE